MKSGKLQVPSRQVADPSPQMHKKLKLLEEMKQEGILDETEYEKKRKKILDNLPDSLN